MADSFYRSNQDLAERDEQKMSSLKETCGGDWSIIDTISKVLALTLAVVFLSVLCATFVSVTGLSGMNSIVGGQLTDLSGVTMDSTRYMKEELGPKLTLVHNSVSGSIPRILAEMKKDITETITARCTPSFNNGSESCEQVIRQVHAPGVTVLNPSTYWRCSSGTPRLDGEITPLGVISEIPGTAIPHGCIRIPTFDMGQLIYSYSHNLISTGCADETRSVQYWQLGYIAVGPTGVPLQQPTYTHTFSDNVNRKSCSTVAVDRGAWLLCKIVVVREVDDYRSPGTDDFSLNYMNTFGELLMYRYATMEMGFDRDYDAFSPSVGSGVYYKNRIIFLGYGGLAEPWGVSAMCEAPGCSDPNQGSCDISQRPPYFSSKQIVNALIEITPIPGERPIMKITTISPAIIWMGAEGRLYTVGGVLYIYVRSTGWHAYPQIGIITSLDPVTIEWTTNTAISRPGSEPCSGDSRCPSANGCITGVYTDMFPLSPDYNYWSSAYLNHARERRAPTIAYGDSDNVIVSALATTANQKASYTTTTCITVFEVGYCFHVIEFSPGALGEFQPVSMMTRIPKTCE